MRSTLLLTLLAVLSHLLSAQDPGASDPKTAPSVPTADQTATAKIKGVSGIDAPGATLTLSVPGDKNQSVTIHSINNPDLDTDLAPIAGQQTTQGLKITLPPTLPAGPYYFRLTDQTLIPGSIDVEPDKIKLVAVVPATAYRRETNRFNFDLVGENFSLDPADDDVTIDGQGSIVKHRAANQKACANQEACLWVQDPRLIHIVGYSPETPQGVVNVGVRVGNVVAADKQQLVLARLSGTVVFILTAAITGLLFLLVRYIVFSGLANKKVGRKRLSLLQAFILDPQTNSFSLSKFQLLLFSATFIFGYIYVLLSRWLVQWQFSLPDVPNTIAGLLGISGGTTIASAGLTASRGSKGAGFQQPTGADLISTGGVVVPERFQFFVWTLVACGGFLALLVGQDPAKVNNFPELPAGLLYIMGVSAAGYLGGKAARKPGPVLELILPEAGKDESTPPVLNVQGQNLDSAGRFFVDDKELGIVSEADKKKYNAPAKLIETTTQVGAADPNFCNRLRITVINSAIELTKGDHTFRIVNLDGQFADYSFSSTPPNIQSVYSKADPPDDSDSTVKSLPKSNTEIAVIVKGSGLNTGSQVTWKSPGDGTFHPQNSAPAGPMDGTMLEVTLVPGEAGAGALNVTTPSGFVTSASVDVVMPPSTAPKPKPTPDPSAATIQAAPAPNNPEQAPATAEPAAPAPNKPADTGGQST